MLAFCLAINNHFLAADHHNRTRRELVAGAADFLLKGPHATTAADGIRCRLALEAQRRCVSCPRRAGRCGCRGAAGSRAKTRPPHATNYSCSPPPSSYVVGIKPSRRRPGGQSPRGEERRCAAGAGGPSVEIALDHVNQRRLDRVPAVLTAPWLPPSSVR